MGLGHWLTRDQGATAPEPEEPNLIGSDVIGKAAASISVHGTPWTSTLDTSLVERIHGPHFPLERTPLVVDGRQPTPVEVARECFKNFSTIVLATVHAGGWRANWINSVVSLIVGNYPVCKWLGLYAVRGGSECDAEIEFILRLLPMMGFEPSGDNGARAHYLHPSLESDFSRWNFMYLRGPRSYQVVLYLADTVRSSVLSVHALNGNLQPWSNYATAPNLARLAVVSAPVRGRDNKPIAEILNNQLAAGLELTVRLAEAKGWGNHGMEYIKDYKTDAVGQRIKAQVLEEFSRDEDFAAF